MIETARLDILIDSAELRKDALIFAESEWQPHFNKGVYDGDWSVIPLRAPANAHMSIYPDPTAETFESTEQLAKCEYLPRLLEEFKCEKESVRFMRLGAGAHIREHRDYKLGIEDGVARIHIPAITNSAVEFWMNSKLVPMREGEAWYLNFNLPHKVYNRSQSPRVHLVIDCIVNDWLRDRISPNGSPKAIPPPDRDS